MPQPKRVNPKSVKIKNVGSIAQQNYIKVVGVDRLVSMFDSLPAKLQKKVIRPVLRNGGKKVLKRAKALVPKDADGHQLPGGKHLRNTLRLRVTKSRSKHEISMKVATGTRKELGIPADQKGYYPSALEYGGLDWFPIPYMRPAYMQTKDEVVKTSRYEIARGIESIVRAFK